MTVTINRYSTELTKRFFEEKKRLLKFLPPSVSIEHVGSSAVQIGGKNIIDILIGAATRKEMKKISKILTKNGYFEGVNSQDDRVFLASKREETNEGDFHIHVCPINEDSYKDFIILRQYLINHQKEANDYLKNKYDFAVAAGFDRKKYKILKSTYVTKLLLKAKNDNENFNC